MSDHVEVSKLSVRIKKSPNNYSTIAFVFKLFLNSGYPWKKTHWTISIKDRYPKHTVREFTLWILGQSK